MNIALDTHCHTLQSRHATATLKENIKSAKTAGLSGLCVTNHGPAYGDSPSEAYFRGLVRLPEKDGDFYIFKGAEVNILDNKGALDLDFECMTALDWVIASIHSVCFSENNKDYVTEAYINAISNPLVHCLGHIGQEKYPCDLETVVKAAKKYDKIIEINNSSLSGMRKGAPKLCRETILLCKKYGVKIAICSDAHSANDIGNFKKSLELVRETDFPEELIINNCIKKFKKYIKNQK